MSFLTHFFRQAGGRRVPSGKITLTFRQKLFGQLTHGDFKTFVKSFKIRLESRHFGQQTFKSLNFEINLNKLLLVR